jgi:hypothetical protein
MALDSPFSDLAIGRLFESLLPDFILAFAFFTALTYAVLGQRFGHQRPAIAMSAAVGLALASGLAWWEYDHGWSVRNLGPIAIGFAVILLAMIMFQGIRQTGGTWSGALLAFGASILVAWILGADWPVPGEIVQTLAIVALVVGIVLFVIHLRGPGHPVSFVPPSAGRELSDVRHDLHDLRKDERVGEQIDSFLVDLRRHTDIFVRHPDDAPNILAQLRRILPAEGWLTQRVAQLRERAHHWHKGHLARLDELKHLVGKLPPEARKQAAEEMAARYEELKLDQRLERLDWAVAESEKRIRQLTLDAEQAVARYDYGKVNELLEAAERLQTQTDKLLRIIDRTEQKLGKVAQDLAKKYAGGDAK